MANESPTLPQLSHGSCRSSEGRMTACPPDQRRPLRRVSVEEVSLAQHVSQVMTQRSTIGCRGVLQTLGRLLSGRVHRNATVAFLGTLWVQR